MTDIEAGLLRGFRPAPSRSGEQMTEDPLLTAIRAYELHIRHCQLLRQQPSDEARDALIDAIRLWRDGEAYGYLSRVFLEYAPQCEVLPSLMGAFDNLLACLPMLQAKAAVCDAYTAYWLADKEVPAGPLRDAMDALTAACAKLRELESKNK